MTEYVAKNNSNISSIIISPVINGKPSEILHKKAKNFPILFYCILYYIIEFYSIERILMSVK